MAMANTVSMANTGMARSMGTDMGMGTGRNSFSSSAAVCAGFGVRYQSNILCQQLFQKFAAVLCICSLWALLPVCRLQEVSWQKPFLMLHRSEYVADVFLLQSGDIVDCPCDREWMGDECLCLVGGSGLLGLPAVGCAG